MPGDWLECYAAMRHDFRYRGARVQTTRIDGWGVCEIVVQMCQRCEKERITTMRKRDMVVMDRRYSRVRGFDAEPGEGRLDAADVKREILRRVREDDW